MATVYLFTCRTDRVKHYPPTHTDRTSRHYIFGTSGTSRWDYLVNVEQSESELLLLVHHRNFVHSLFGSITWGLQLVLSDYGLIPSIIAFSALATIPSFLFFTLRSTFVSRRNKKVVASPERKKKKKKGSARYRSSQATRPKPAPSTAAISHQATLSPCIENDATIPMPSKDIYTPDLAPLSPVSIVPIDTKLPKDTISTTHSIRSMIDVPETSMVSIPTLLTPAKPLERDAKGRNRLASVSTIDTTSMSDDLSCGSMSNRSFPSVSVGSSNSTSNESVAKSPSFGSSKVPAAKLNVDKQCEQEKTIPSNKVRTTKSKATRRKENSSRWDALKPASPKVASAQQVDLPKNTPKPKSSGPGLKQPKQTIRAGRNGGVNMSRAQNVNSKSPPRVVDRRGQTPATTKPRNSPPRVPSPSEAVAATGNRSAPKTAKSVTQGGTKFPRKRSVAQSPRVMPPPALNPLPVGGLFDSSLDTGNHLYLAPKASEPAAIEIPSVNPSTSAPAPSSWASDPSRDGSFISPSFLNMNDHNARNEPTFSWNQPSSFTAPSAPVYGTSAPFGSFPQSSLGYHNTPVLKENPFASDAVLDYRNTDEQIEAQLQELGGQMAGSILDF
eukprot:Nitzschia sp. Nitz4//scaffold234_size30613//18237//20122//NITZ4_007964-RA/size30613-processed-gene-0.34-mRNA-1//1//CDS//3329543419//4074//frame0